VRVVRLFKRNNKNENQKKKTATGVRGHLGPTDHVSATARHKISVNQVRGRAALDRRRTHLPTMAISHVFAMAHGLFSVHSTTRLVSAECDSSSGAGSIIEHTCKITVTPERLGIITIEEQ